MCNNDLGDGCAVDAGGVHVFGKLACTWHVMRPGADVDEDRFGMGAHQRDIARRQDHISATSNRGLDVRLGCIAGEIACGNAKMAITEDRHREFTMRDGLHGWDL